MTTPSQLPLGAIAAFLVSGALGLYGLDRGRRGLAVVFKPLTTALLLAIVLPGVLPTSGRPASTQTWLVVAGVVASIAGDAALLWKGTGAFLIGLGFFLAAHLLYVFAFLQVAAWPPGSLLFFWMGPAAMAIATPALLRTLWPAVGGPLRGPVLAYGAAISAMVIAAFSTLGGPWGGAPLAAIGSVLFYISDASLAINKFVRPLRHAPLLSVGVYWLGQLGIALATRWPG